MPVGGHYWPGGGAGQAGSGDTRRKNGPSEQAQFRQAFRSGAAEIPVRPIGGHGLERHDARRSDLDACGS